jgi:hypothetical protein
MAALTCSSLQELDALARARGLEAALTAPIAALEGAALGLAERYSLEKVIRRHRPAKVGDLFHAAIDREIAGYVGRGGLRKLAGQLETWMFDHGRDVGNGVGRSFEGTDVEVVVDEDEFDDDDLGEDDEDLDLDLDLFAAQSLRAAAAETEAAPPPSERAALRAWAQERGVLERLSDPAPVPFFPGRPDALAPGTLEEVLSPPPSSPSKGRYDPRDALARVRRDTAVATLMRFVRNVAYLRARQRELDAKAQPLDPALAAFAEAVAQARAALASPTGPRPAGDALPVPLHFLEGPARLVYDEASSPRDTLLLGYRTPNLVDVLLAGWEHGGLSVACRCRKAGCVHRDAALAQVEELLRQPSASAYQPLHTFVTTPSWTRVFERLDRALATLPGATPPERLIWRLSCDGADQVVLEPQLQKRTAQGGWSKGGRVGFRDFVRRPQLLRDPQDALVAELLIGEEGAAWRERPAEGTVFRAIEALAGAGNVYLGDRRDAPVAIRRLVPRLELARPAEARAATSRGEGATLVLRARIGEALLSPGEVLARLRAERFWIDLDARTRTFPTGSCPSCSRVSSA